MTKGMIFDVQSFAIHDGMGVRTLVFMKGCALRCWWCHNPEGRESKPEVMFTGFRCINDCLNCVDNCKESALIHDSKVTDIDRTKCTACGNCADACPTSAIRTIGKLVEPDEILDEIEKYAQVYDNSEGGVTFSGGDPLFQPEFLKEALKLCKSHHINTAIETSGYTSREVLESIFPYIDQFLYDIKIFDSGAHRLHTSVPNEVIKENLLFLVENGLGSRITLRFPIIPGITDTKANVNGWVDFFSRFKEHSIRNVNLLPYHDVGEKFGYFGLEYRMNAHSAPAGKTVEWIKSRFESLGMTVKIGG